MIIIIRVLLRISWNTVFNFRCLNVGFQDLFSLLACPIKLFLLKVLDPFFRDSKRNANIDAFIGQNSMDFSKHLCTIFLLAQFRISAQNCVETCLVNHSIKVHICKPLFFSVHLSNIHFLKLQFVFLMYIHHLHLADYGGRKVYTRDILEAILEQSVSQVGIATTNNEYFRLKFFLDSSGTYECRFDSIIILEPLEMWCIWLLYLMLFVAALPIINLGILRHQILQKNI